MMQTILPDSSEQEAYFSSYREPLKKSISIQRHHNLNFEQDYNEFDLSDSVFDEFEDTVYVDRDDTSIALWNTWQHMTGKFYIQEVAAALPANILKQHFKQFKSETDNSTLKILDIAAAPGWKTAQIADFLLANNISWLVWGNDIDTKRLWTRASNIQRCGLYNTVATKLDGSQIGNLVPEFFDAILVDAPCSGEWTGFKSDAAYKWRKQESINRICGLQAQIIDSALKACKPGGIIVYSTCTLNPYENEHQIKRLIDNYGDAIEILPINVANKSPGIVTDLEFVTGEEDKMLRARPHRHHTGWFFVCMIRKTRSTLLERQKFITTDRRARHHSRHVKHVTRTAPLFQYNKSLEKKLFQQLESIYGIKLDKNKYTLIEWKHKMYLADSSVKSLLEEWIRLHECGIPILKQTKSTWSLEHTFSLALGHLAQHNTLDLSADQVQQYVLWNDIQVDWLNKLKTVSGQELFNNYIILTHANRWVWVAKIVDGIVKNKRMKR